MLPDRELYAGERCFVNERWFAFVNGVESIYDAPEPLEFDEASPGLGLRRRGRDELPVDTVEEAVERGMLVPVG